MVVERTDGLFEFRIYAPRATSIELMGDFTESGRGTLAMLKNDEGWWTVRCSVPPGDHEFMYVINGSAHVPDYAANGVRWNEDGQWVSLLCVTDEPSEPAGDDEEWAPTKEPAGTRPGRDAFAAAGRHDPANARRLIIHKTGGRR